MSAYIDITGKVYNGIEVISAMSRTHYNCKCHCGNAFITKGANLKSGNTRSCGCGKATACKQNFFKHGLSKHPLRSIWSNMKARCHNNKNNCYNNYGGRGIHVCSDWLNNSKCFIEWALSNGWRFGLEIDRKNNNDGYSPDNCHFVSHIENSYNRRVTVNIKYNGEDMNFLQLSKINGVSPRLIRKRLRKGWDIDKAIKATETKLIDLSKK
jgi:hypothetical protein